MSRELTGNVGEWSELYVFISLLADGLAFGADRFLNTLNDSVLHVVSIIRKEDRRGGEIEYERSSDGQFILIKDRTGSRSIPMQVFTDAKSTLLTELLIRRNSHQGGSFAVPMIEDFMSQVMINSLSSWRQGKRDITVTVHDERIGGKLSLGFSIKSNLGGSPTLLNASAHTNIRYRLDPKITPREMESINSEGGPAARVSKIIENGRRLEPCRMVSNHFKWNQEMIDSKLPIVISEIVLLYYITEFNKIADLVREVTERNPCGYDQDAPHPFYQYKMKRFLSDIALGMTPTSTWNGIEDATGGYLVVKHDGKIVFFSMHNRNEFQEYLLMNTKLDTPSTRRHRFGVVFEQGSDYFLDLNLQIRFL